MTSLAAHIRQHPQSAYGVFDTVHDVSTFRFLRSRNLSGALRFLQALDERLEVLTSKTQHPVEQCCILASQFELIRGS